MDSKLKAICEEILDNETDTDCDGDLTLTATSGAAIKKLRKYMKKVYEAETGGKRNKELIDLREAAAQECFEKHDLDGLECVDQEGWEMDGANTFIKKFYYEDKENPNELSKPATFIVGFKKGSDKINDVALNIW